MTEQTATTGRVWRRMTGRAGDEPHRVSTPLELLFDLCFVVAVSSAAARLHHAEAGDHIGSGVLAYLMVFFAIWWAWMNFTWFASAYDTDDVPYRIMTLIQIAGVLVLAAGTPRAFDTQDYTVITVGYLIMRVALVGQWLRAARDDPQGRATALRYAAGIAVLQVGWIARLWLPERLGIASFAVLAAAELAVSPLAERRRPTSWHRHHIAERYGLFTIIVLGESILSATPAVQLALDDPQATTRLCATAAGGLLTVFGLWWIYFAQPAGDLLVSNRVAFGWGYGHYLILAAAAAAGAGIAVNVDHITHRTHHLSDLAAGATLTVPVAIFLVTIWLLHLRPHADDPARSVVVPATAILVLAATATPQPVLATGLLVSALTAIEVTLTARHPPPISA